MLPCASYGKINGTFTLPDSVLLFETDSPGAPYDELLVVSTMGTVVVQAPSSFWGQLDTMALAPGADRIVWGLSLHDDFEKKSFKSVLGMYSLLDKSWKTYGDFCANGVGSAAFSPDGTKIAFASRSGITLYDSRSCSDNPYVLQILDIATGMITTIPNSEGVMENARLSWSPDGRYIAFQVGGWDPPHRIALIDVVSGTKKEIADGINPSWSPNGDWIAYTDRSMQKCILIHPDGTGAKVVRDLGKGLRFGYWIFHQGAMWSPDGKRLLFDEETVDSGGRDVTILDLSSGKVTKVSRNSPFVLGWVAERH
jgi:WD40 repeat protein